MIKKRTKLLLVLAAILSGLAVFTWVKIQLSKKIEPTPPKTKVVRPSALAGTWYSKDPGQLTNDINGYIAQATPQEFPGRLIALISPHAGHSYSGRAAAYSYKLLTPNSYKKVIILAPSHHGDRGMAYRGISLPEEDFYETPLGEIQIDKESVSALLKSPHFTRHPDAEAREHSVEIHLPFLQLTLGSFKLVPLLVGVVDPKDYGEIASDIKKVVDTGTLIIGSSDFTHYGPNFGYIPFPSGNDVQEKLKKLDQGSIDRILGRDSSQFDEYIRETGTTICGATPISILLNILPQTSSGHLLKYDTSGNITGDYTNSVSYVSIAFHDQAPAVSSSLDPIPDNDMEVLPAMARKTLESFFSTGKFSEEAILSEMTLSEHMKKDRGAFVTLMEEGVLRGCIGTIDPVMPLYKAVMENSINAAINDRRFMPVSAGELEKIHIEVSVLSPKIPIDLIDEFKVGLHGIIMKKGFRSAVFLPQVATEQNWTSDETLNHLSEKAGLERDAWREGTKFWVFTAQIAEERL